MSKPNTRSETVTSAGGVIITNSPVTKDGIKSMLWSTYNNNNTYASTTSSAKCPSTVVQLRYIAKINLDDNNNEKSIRKLWNKHQQQKYHQEMDCNSNSTYALYLSDNEFTVTAMAEEAAFKGMMISNNNKKKNIERIEDIPINTFICIEDYVPTFLSNYKHCIYINSFRIHSYDHRPTNELSSSIPPPFVDDQRDRGDIIVLKWVEWMKDNTNIKKLQDKSVFEFMNLGSTETRIVADALRVNKTLTHFHYTANRMGNKGMEYLVDALQDNDTVVYLDVSDNDITYPGVKAMAMYLKQNPKIWKVNLSYNTIGGRGANILASVFDNNTTLSSLDLSYGKINTCGIIALANMLKINRTLLSLSLSNNEVSDNGVCALATSLSYNHTLQRLDISNNQIGPIGITALAKALKYNTGLKELQIERNYNICEKDGIIPIYEALEYNTTLQVLVHGRLLPDPDRSTQQQLQEEYNNTMQQLMDYNDTLKYISNLDLPRFIQKIDLRWDRRSNDANDDDNDNDSTITTTRTDRVAPKKGQRQKQDMYRWLLYSQQDWPINISSKQQPIRNHNSRNRQRRSERRPLLTESTIVVTTSNKKCRR